MSTGTQPRQHIVWPAYRFYWALLDASVLPRGLMHRKPDPKGLGYLFEAELPVPIDRVHAVYLPMGDRQYLACGVEHEKLDEDESLGGALTLVPDGLPEEVFPQGTVDPQTINLLCGPHEPVPVRRQRRRLIVECAGLAALILLLIVFGAERRIGAWNRATEDVQANRQDVYEDLYPPATSAPSAQPASLRLLAELRQLERTRGGAAHSIDLEEPQSGRTLAALLEHWPSGKPILTESINVTPASVALVGLLPTAPMAQEFVTGFELPAQWEARQPQISAVSDGVRLTWRLVRRQNPPQASNPSDTASGSEP